jgi:hypothetical protein
MDVILRWSRDFPGIFINYTLNTTAMSELDEIEMERQEAGGIVQKFICRATLQTVHQSDNSRSAIIGESNRILV